MTIEGVRVRKDERMTALSVTAIETRARALIAKAIGRPCVRVKVGPASVVTQWLTAGDASRAAAYFGAELRQAMRLSYDSESGWLCEAAREFR